ncbi:sensor histidine kinase [Nocardioides sp. SYSU D00038]|uniref:sensor histidine kinase n=1 Tax=Nocardioides sp. SYSU D00038 TaxID=2812554 RepID=UPI00196894F7|nr:histidine kinase [Nocardioides sp. SYSU D00038]
MQRPTPEEYQPRLSAWGHGWRTALVLSISLVVWFTIAERQSEEMFVLDVALGLPCVALVYFRRRWPMRVALVTAVLSAVSSLAAGPATLAAVSLATRRRWPQVLVISAVSLVAAWGFTEVQPATDEEPFWLITSTNVIFVAAVMAWGMYVGSRRELIWTLRNRAERAEAEQELRVEQSRGNERARIAREMHDVLAHRISQIAMHAGALSYREDLTPEQVRDSAGVIQEKAHEALTDLRGVLGVLRDRQGDPAAAPQPTWCDLPTLAEDARRSGLNVELHDRVEGGPVPDVLGRTVYRIVQEGMTNAQKHAPGAALTILLTGSPDEGIHVELRNPLGFGRSTTPGAGLGLIGLSERAELRGGRLEHRIERRPDGPLFVLSGWIPWAA